MVFVMEFSLELEWAVVVEEPIIVGILGTFGCFGGSLIILCRRIVIFVVVW